MRVVVIPVLVHNDRHIPPLPVQQHIARLAPLVCPPEIVERSLVVLLPLLCGRLICAGREFPLDSFSRFGYTVLRRICVGGVFAVNPGSESPGGVGSSVLGLSTTRSSLLVTEVLAFASSGMLAGDFCFIDLMYFVYFVQNFTVSSISNSRIREMALE